MRLAPYLRFTRNSIQTLLAYRANVLFYIFGNIVQTLVLWYLWRAIFAGSATGRVNGFTLGEMAAYLLAAVAAQSAIGGNAEDVISDEIMEGSIAVNLARPLDYRTRIFFGHLGASLYNGVVARPKSPRSRRPRAWALRARASPRSACRWRSASPSISSINSCSGSPPS